MTSQVRLEKLRSEHGAILPFMPAGWADHTIADAASEFFAAYDGTRPVSVVGLLDQGGGMTELFVATNPNDWGKGYASGAIHQLLVHTFGGTSPSTSCTIYADCLNGRAAERIVQKLGFRQVTSGAEKSRYTITRDEWNAPSPATP